MSTSDINAGKPQKDWIIPAGEVVVMYDKKYQAMKKENNNDCYCCAFYDKSSVNIGMTSSSCSNSPICLSYLRKAVGGDSVHFVEVQ